MIFKEDKDFRVSTVSIKCQSFDKYYKIVLSEEKDLTCPAPFSMNTILTGRPFFAGFLFKGEDDKYWNYKIHPCPLEFRNDASLYNSYKIKFIPTEADKEVLYYCLFYCRRGIETKEEARNYVKNIKSVLTRWIRYGLTSLFDPRDKFLYEKLIYVHGKEIDNPNIYATEIETNKYPIAFYSRKHDYQYTFGLVNGGILNHRLINFKNSEIDKSIKDMSSDEFLKMINNLRFELEYSLNKSFRRGDIDYIHRWKLEFADAEDLVNCIEYFWKNIK